MDGSDPKIVIKDKISNPEFLTIDLQKEVLYFSSSHTPKIESCNLDGSNRQTILSSEKNHPIAKPTGIAVFERRLYYVDPKYEKVARVDALSPSTEASNKILTRTTSATTACLNDYEAQWIAMATTRKMSVDNAEGLLEAVRSHTTKRHEGVVRWYTEKKHYGFIEAPGAAATDLFVHASEVTEPLRAGDKVSFVIGERRGRSAATKVEVLERAPPPPPRVFTPVAFGGQQAGFAPYQPYGYAGEVPESVPVFS